jgi:hypothetical protein
MKALLKLGFGLQDEIVDHGPSRRPRGPVNITHAN